jgi:hypothetical protein
VVTGGPAVFHDGYTSSNLTVDASTIASAEQHALAIKGYEIDASGDVVPITTPRTPGNPGNYASAVGRRA